MKTSRNWILMALLPVLAAGMLGCSQEDSLTGPEIGKTYQATTTELDDIVDTAIGAGIFNTLVAAVQAADLVDVLRGEGPFTVFAPTDEAFENLPEGLVEALLMPQNQGKLQELLLYHVVAGQIESGDLRWFQFTETVQGQYLWIRKLWGNRVKVNNAQVISPDVMASNGVIHVINAVLIPRGFELEMDPPEPQNDIVDTAIAAGSFNTLVAAAGAAELVDALRGEGPLTVFAPTDEAFAKLPAELVEALLLPENKAKLQELLLYHVLEGQVLSSDLRFYQRVETLQGSKVRIIKWFNNVWVDNSKVTTPDVLATNGVIHVISRVLIPQGFSLDGHDKAGLDALVASRDQQEAPPTEFPVEYR
jgi:uncharacterized surface protein with fasciclin (FAS1) repeats